MPKGGMGEPYCSAECREQGGRYASAVMMKNQSGVCGFCQKPVQASMFGDVNCAVVPYEGVNLFICKDCVGAAKRHLATYDKCCMCQGSLR